MTQACGGHKPWSRVKMLNTCFMFIMPCVQRHHAVCSTSPCRMLNVITLDYTCYMNYFTNLLATFLDMGTFQLLSMEGLWALRYKKKNILICVLTMNRCLTGLGRHQVINSIIFIFWWTNPLMLLFSKWNTLNRSKVTLKTFIITKSYKRCPFEINAVLELSIQ